MQLQSGLANMTCDILTTFRFWQKLEGTDHQCWILPWLFYTSIRILQLYRPERERRNVPPPEIGKIVAEIWCYLPDVSKKAESEIQKIFSKNCEKKSIFHRDFSRFSWKFSKFASFLVPMRKTLQTCCLNLNAQLKSFIKSWGYCIFL